MYSTAIVSARSRPGRIIKLNVHVWNEPTDGLFQTQHAWWLASYWSWTMAAMQRKVITQRNFIENSRTWCHVSYALTAYEFIIKFIVRNVRLRSGVFIDFPDIQTDQRRIEHIEALSSVLKDILGENLLPKPEELVAIYGRVWVIDLQMLIFCCL